MNHRQLIENALSHAADREIRIERGAVFDWCDSDGRTPKACNAFGAMLLLVDPDLLERDSKRRWNLVREYLGGVGVLWEYRFHQGFDRHRRLDRAKLKDGKPERDRNGELVMVPDEVSRLGYELSRQFCG